MKNILKEIVKEKKNEVKILKINFHIFQLKKLLEIEQKQEIFQML